MQSYSIQVIWIVWGLTLNVLTTAFERTEKKMYGFQQTVCMQSLKKWIYYVDDSFVELSKFLLSNYVDNF